MPETPQQPDVGEFGATPVEDWIPTPVSDSADYLDREPPEYLEDEEPPEEPSK